MANNVLDQFRVGGFDYELRQVYCGKAACKKCPHGPYWYFTFKTGTGKKVTKYCGKRLPEGVVKPCLQEE